MLSFEDGFAKIMGLAQPLETEIVPIAKAAGRILREDIVATRPQPSFDNSAMDGYGLAGASETYQIIGEIAAGARELPTLQAGQAVRIFTGAPIPKGVDRVLIQENADVNGVTLTPQSHPIDGAHMRRKGQDFDTGFTLSAGRILTPQMIALIAAMNCNKVSVTRLPKVAILATGSELVNPGFAALSTDVIASNAFGIAAQLSSWGADFEILPIINDDIIEITAALENTDGFDVVVTTGGASVGDYDFVPQAAKNAGFEIALNKIAMRPGKPVLAGRRKNTVFIGLPGNPVSASIASKMFLGGLIKVLSGLEASPPQDFQAKLGCSIPQNGDRKHFMRAEILSTDAGLIASPLSNQDSSMILMLEKANGLVVREPDQPAGHQGDVCRFIWI